MENSLDELNITLDTTEENTSELEDRAKESLQTVAQRDAA